MVSYCYKHVAVHCYLQSGCARAIVTGVGNWFPAKRRGTARVIGLAQCQFRSRFSFGIIGGRLTKIFKVGTWRNQRFGGSRFSSLRGLCAGTWGTGRLCFSAGLGWSGCFAAARPAYLVGIVALFTLCVITGDHKVPVVIAEIDSAVGSFTHISHLVFFILAGLPAVINPVSGSF
jgi:hypothetical protein